MFSYSIAFASEKISLKTEKINSKYALIDKTANREVLPAIYDKIRKVKYDKKNIFIGETANYITLYSPDGLYDNFLRKYYLSNKYNSAVKFINYPEKAVIVYKQNKKFGLIAFENGILNITKPIYEKVSYPDENSIVSRFLNISYAPYDSIIVYSSYIKGQYKFETLKNIFSGGDVKYSISKIIFPKAEINEKIDVNETEMNVIYKNINFPEKKMIISDNKQENNKYSIEDIFSHINNTPFTFKGYPHNFVLKTGYHLFVYNNGEKSQIIKPCSDFQIQESLIRSLTGLDIDFDSNNIIAKHSEWGIINGNNEIKVPFQYDLIIPLGSEVYEDIIINENQTVIEYKGKRETGLFLVKKGYGWGIINENNKIIVPFEFKRSMENSE